MPTLSDGKQAKSICEQILGYFREDTGLITVHR